MRAMLHISFDKDSYLDKLKRAEKEIIEQYDAIRQIAERFRKLELEEETAPAAMLQDLVFVEVDEGSVLQEIEKNRREMIAHFRAIEDVVNRLEMHPIMRELKVSAVPENKSDTAET